MLDALSHGQDRQIQEKPGNIFSKAYREQWNAAWITHPAIALGEFSVVHFRKTFNLDEKPESFIIHVTADNRYRLFVNGHDICEGPQRSDTWHWRYATVDIAPFLRDGKNLIAAQVVNWGHHRAISQFSNKTGFLLQGYGEKEETVNTQAGSWKTLHNQAHYPFYIDYHNREHVRGYYAANPTDSIVGILYPWGWEQPDYDDSHWKNAKWLSHAATREVFRSLWSLTPRTIPMLRTERHRFSHLERVEGADIRTDFIDGNHPLTVPAHANVSILIDNGLLTMAYPELVVSRGKGSRIQVIYSEALYNDEQEKENRDKTQGMHIWGIEDNFIPGGGNNRVLRTLWLRAFRYVQLNIETGADPLVIEDYSHVFSAYPLERKGFFRSDVPEHEKITGLGWQSIKICTQENLMPDAYYEQSQAAFDGRIHANTIMYTCGDSLPFKQFIRQFDYSRLPDGLTQGYAPDRHHLVISTFSLYWILAIHDYYMHYDDPEFVREQLPGIQAVLTWYENNLQDNGFMGPVNWWSFMDWYGSTQDVGRYWNSEAKGTFRGRSAAFSLLLSYTLKRSAEIFSDLGNDYFANHYAHLSGKINSGVYNHCFDQARGLLAETPDRTSFSQHSNILGVLSGAIPAGDAHEVMHKVIRDKSLTQCTMPFYSNLFDAMYLSGLAGEIVSALDLWYDFLDWGLTTTPEKPSINPRSDCHPWSSSPNYILPKYVAGIMPGEPGFKSVRIKPAPGQLEFFESNVPHGKGDIRVKMEKKGDKRIFEVSMPEGLGGTFIWKGKTKDLEAGRNQTFEF